MIKPLSLSIVLGLCTVACGGDDGERIVDIGKTCSSASDCEHYCVGPRGAATGRCSIECAENSECPSLMECAENLVGERRCLHIGLVVTGLDRWCQVYCEDVAYYCTTGDVTETEVDGCVDWCYDAAEPEQDAFLDCVDAEPRYVSACPAADCVLDRLP